MMKRIIYFISTILVAAMYSCSGQYDNIEQYATDETVYAGKFSDNPYVLIGYKRVEIELLGDTVGRIFSDDIFLGKAKKTIVEYEESEGVRRIEFDSVCSWVNITGLTIAKTYIFKIYSEDEEGHKSIAVEALGKPFTDDDLAGFAFPMPYVIPSPTTVEFAWGNIALDLYSPLYKFVELIYSYVDNDNKTISGRLTARDNGFSLRNLKQNENTRVTIDCRIIPLMDAKQIIDTVSMVREIVTAPITKEEYLAERTVRPIVSALINADDNTKATITLGEITDHLAWTEIRYKRQSTGNWCEPIRIDNGTYTLLCEDIKRNEPIQIRCTYIPTNTDLQYTGTWTEHLPFFFKCDRSDWVVVPRHGSHYWPEGVGNQQLWNGGHPMLILDDDPSSGWHSIANDPVPPFPQVLVIDMKKTQQVSRIIASGDYWNTVQLYLTNNLSIPGYTSHTVDWNDNNRESNYNNWIGTLTSLIPANVPESWGVPVVRNEESGNLSITFEKSQSGRFLILRFPDNTVWTPDWPATFIDVFNVEVYTY